MEYYFLLYDKDGHVTMEPVASESNADMAWSFVTQEERDFYDSVVLMFGDPHEPYGCKTIKEYK